MTKSLNFALKIKGVVGRVAHAKSSDSGATPRKKFETCTLSKQFIVVPYFSLFPANPVICPSLAS